MYLWTNDIPLVGLDWTSDEYIHITAKQWMNRFLVTVLVMLIMMNIAYREWKRDVILESNSIMTARYKRAVAMNVLFCSRRLKRKIEREK